jgi:hypothetical protein
MITLGFTGTRDGMTAEQKKAVRKIMQQFNIRNFRHGDCIGADAEAHDIFVDLYGRDPIIHPPVDEEHRAFKTRNIILPPKTHFARNRDIVDMSGYMLVAPKHTRVQTRGGTWYTHAYAEKKQVPWSIVWPDGRIQHSTEEERHG